MSCEVAEENVKWVRSMSTGCSMQKRALKHCMVAHGYVCLCLCEVCLQRGSWLVDSVIFICNSDVKKHTCGQ